MEEKNKKIILLEDEEVLGGLYKRKLESEGYEVEYYMEIDDVIKNAKEDIKLFILDNFINGDKRETVDIIPDIKKLSPYAKIVLLTNSHMGNSDADVKLLKIDTSPTKLLVYLNRLFAS